MYESDVLDVPQRALTGALPSEPRVTALLHEAHARYATLDSGAVAPASRLPKYVPSEIPDPEPVPTD